MALGLARDPALLGAIRATLVANRARAPLFDTPRYLRNDEAALKHMAALDQAGRYPKSFDVVEAAESVSR